jgi:hypothetical protein
MLQLLSGFRPRELCKSLEVGSMERYSIIGYLPHTMMCSANSSLFLGFNLSLEDAPQKILSRPIGHLSKSKRIGITDSPLIHASLFGMLEQRPCFLALYAQE